MSEITQMLERVRQGSSGAAAELIPLVYQELRRLAAYRMSLQPPGQTLQATALVHEAYVKLAASAGPGWQHRGHFFAAAAEAMRQILVDQARRKLRQKHGGGAARVDLAEVEIAVESPDERLLEIHEALGRLTAIDPVKAEVVKLHFFAGFTHAETAEALALSEKTVRRHWSFARAWLYQSISEARRAGS